MLGHESVTFPIGSQLGGSIAMAIGLKFLAIGGGLDATRLAQELGLFQWRLIRNGGEVELQ